MALVGVCFLTHGVILEWIDVVALLADGYLEMTLVQKPGKRELDFLTRHHPPTSVAVCQGCTFERVYVSFALMFRRRWCQPSWRSCNDAKNSSVLDLGG